MPKSDRAAIDDTFEQRISRIERHLTKMGFNAQEPAPEPAAEPVAPTPEADEE